MLLVLVLTGELLQFFSVRASLWIGCYEFNIDLFMRSPWILPGVVEFFLVLWGSINNPDTCWLLTETEVRESYRYSFK